MMFLASVKFVLIIFLIESLYSNVECRICTERQIVETSVRETYPWYVQESYRTCYFGFNCKKTRWRFTQRERIVRKNIEKIFQKCCAGYIVDDENAQSNSIKCNPICMPGCINGYCKNPGECGCNTGYMVDSKNSHNCLPVCTKGCEHGTCETPDNCICNFGYNLLNGTCQPVCTEPCHNGICIEPEHCQCQPGYRKSEMNVCEPYCSSGCDHGSCVGPETCSCEPGWEIMKTNDSMSRSCIPVCTEPCKNGTCVAPHTCACNSGFILSDKNKCEPYCSGGCDRGSCIAPETCRCDSGWQINKTNVSEICQPLCTKPCDNGTCVAPETCNCNPGYRMSNNSKCEPYCSSGCIYGICTSPETCICETGWYKNDESECVALCDLNCGNGSCTTPNVCECFTGYSLDTAKFLTGSIEGPLCVPTCINCEGACVAPNKCVCELPFVAKHVKADGGDCDCFDECSDQNSKCERTLCLRITTVVGTTNNYYEASESSTDNDLILNSETIYFGTHETTYEVTSNGEISQNYTNNINLTNLKLQNDQENWIQSNWIYAVLALLLTVVVVLLILMIMNWKSLLIYLKGSSYVVEDNKTEAVEEQFVNIQFSSIVNKRQSRQAIENL